MKPAPFKALVGKTIVDPKGNKYVIPQISREQAETIAEQNEKRIIDDYLKNKPRQFLKENSKINNNDSLDVRFEQLKRVNDEVVQSAKKALAIAKDFVGGKRYNVFFQGKQGRGKTTLATCIINYVLDNSEHPPCCAIINASRIGRLVNTYDDSNGIRMQKKSDFNVLLKRLKKDCEILVIDDLGKETSFKKDDIREANDSVQKAWYDISDIMQKKQGTMIVTSNFTTKELSQMYNPAILSRMFAGAKEHNIIFDGEKIADMRINGDELNVRTQH